MHRLVITPSDPSAQPITVQGEAEALGTVGEALINAKVFPSAVIMRRTTVERVITRQREASPSTDKPSDTPERAPKPSKQ